MPIFAYVCSECGHETEDLRSLSTRDEPMPCAKCGAEATRNPINTGTSFSIKGAGVYHQGQPKYKGRNKKYGQ